MKKIFFEIIRLCYTPISIFSPVPFFAIMVFVLAYKNIPLTELPIPLLIAGMSVSLLTSFASNFWNHTNDIIEDLAQGKRNALTENMISRRHAVMISFLLYLASGFLIGYISLEVKRPSYLFFYIWALVTWWYSDNIFLKRIFQFRLKSHYIGELITYTIAYPTYTLGTWLIYSDLNMTGLILAAAFSCFGISVVLLKDLKDISGDRKAGLRTFGVVFPPSKLIYFSCVLLLL
jgi:1,4-dihydroxy-2-naphthoate octaprenyltransferase